MKNVEHMAAFFWQNATKKRIDDFFRDFVSAESHS